MKSSAGYSGKPLASNLGLREGYRISFVASPTNYLSLIGDLPAGTEVLGNRSTKLDLRQPFTTSRSELKHMFPRSKRRIKPDGMLWISWPKSTSKLQSDLNENVVRGIGLANGLVDIKVIAVDDNWSGLKFVYRLRDRARPSS